RSYRIDSEGLAMIARHEQAQIDRANASGTRPVVFVHGLWLLSASWDRWRTLFEEHGYATLAPGWPDDPETVAEANDRQRRLRRDAPALGRPQRVPLGHAPRRRALRADEHRRPDRRHRRPAPGAARARRLAGGVAPGRRAAASSRPTLKRDGASGKRSKRVQ